MKQVLGILSILFLTYPLMAKAVDINANPDAVEDTKQAPKPAPEESKDKVSNIIVDGLSGLAAVTTNYMFRGISQTQNYPAIQTGLTWTSPIDIYLNFWASNVRFAETTANLEIDTMVGYKGGIGDNFSYDLNYGRYNYPGAVDLEYNEFNSVFNYYFLQAGLSYSGNVYNSHHGGTYYNGGINYEIPCEYAFGIQNLTLVALMGHYSLPRAAGYSYNDYQVSLTKQMTDVYSIAGMWTATNGRARQSPYDDNQLVGTITANF